MIQSNYLEYGHFLGKTGNHIDAKLDKKLLFSDEKRLSRAVGSLIHLTSLFSPELIVSEESHGALLARQVGEALDIPALIYTKGGSVKVTGEFDKERKYRATIVEDNVITGSSVRRLIKRVEELNVRVDRVVSVFSSVAGDIDLGVDHTALINLSIKSVAPGDCGKCSSVYSHA